MFLRKKIKEAEADKIIIKYIKEKLDSLEQPIVFEYDEEKGRFNYAKSPSYFGSSYEKQDFYFTMEY